MDNELKLIYYNDIINTINEVQVILSKINVGFILHSELKINLNHQLKLRNYHIYRSDNEVQDSKPYYGNSVIFVRR